MALEKVTQTGNTVDDIRTAFAKVNEAIDKINQIDATGLPGGAESPVQAVAGKTGLVTLEVADVAGAASTTALDAVSTVANDAAAATAALTITVDDVASTAEGAETTANAASAAVDELTADEDLLAEPTVSNILNADDLFLGYNPKIASDTMEPLVHGTVGSTLSVDASLRREQIWTLSGALALLGSTDTLQGSVKLRFKSTGSFTITPDSSIRVRSADTSPIVTTNGQEAVLVITARTDSTGVRRTEIERIDVFGAAALVAPVIVSTQISTGGVVRAWSNTPGASFDILENVTGNLAPTVTRTMTFNGDANAQTGTTFVGPTGLKGKFRITTSAINASGGPITAVTEAWIGKKAPVWIGETWGDRSGTTGASVNIAIHGSAIAGDFAILATNQQSAADVAPPTGFTAFDAAIPRVTTNGTTAGNNQHFQLFWKVLDAADLTATLFAVTLNANSFGLLTILRGVDTATWDNADFTRSASLTTTTTLASSTVVAADAALELMYVYSGSYADGAKIASATGYTLGTVFDITGADDTVASDYGISTLRREVSDGTLAAVTVTVGSIAKTTQITRLLAYGPVNA